MTVCMVNLMNWNQEVMDKMAQYLCKPGMSKEAAEYLQNKVETIIQDEKLSGKELRKTLYRASDDELMDYVPDVYQKDIYKIDYERLKKKGIKLISFDIDDTIDESLFNKLEANIPGLTVDMPDDAKKLMCRLKKMGFTVVLLTNAQKELAEGACKSLGLKDDECIARARKPETGGFEKFASKYKLDKSQMAHVGNSMRADIAGGNRYGVTTCLIRRAGVAIKLVKFAMMGVPTKGHVIREELLERDIWRKHHVYLPGDQYYQLGEEPAYRKESRELRNASEKEMDT